MKTLFVLLLSFTASISLAGTDAAIAYNDQIVTEQNNISRVMIAFSSSPSEEGIKAIKSQAKSSLAVLKKMKPYLGESTLLDAAKELFTFYSEVSQNEYKDILELINKKDKYTQEELTRKLNELVSAISAKEKPLDNKFGAAQKAFAAKYGFVLEKNEVQEEIDAAGNTH